MSDSVILHDGQGALKPSERAVLEPLLEQLRAEGYNAHVFTNFELIFAENDRELDITVIIEDLGIAVIEVKGGQIRYHEGTIERHLNGRWQSADLKNQLQSQRTFVRKMLRADDPAIWPKNHRIPVATLFVAPDSELQQGLSIPGVETMMVIGKSNLDSMSYIIRELLIQTRPQSAISNFPTEKYNAALEAFLGEQEDYEKFVAHREHRGVLVEKLTREQVFILDVLQDNPNTLILGASGSGKTVVAVEQAVRLKKEGKRVGLMCYNIGLASYLKEACAKLDEKLRPDFVGSIFEDLPAIWHTNLEEFRVDDEGFWEQSVPQGLAKRAAIQSPQLKFDAWVIDEAQDFKESWWDIVLNGSKKPNQPNIHLFGDLKQDLYSRHAEELSIQSKVKTPWFYAIGRLGGNLRNVRSIARVLNLIGGTDDAEHGAYVGFAPEYHQVASYQDVRSHADWLVQQALDLNWEPKDIAVLNAYRRFDDKMPSYNDKEGMKAYWEEYFHGNSVFYGTSLGFKGLDRPVVIVCLDDPGLANRDNHSNDLYVAFGRARDELTIVGTEEGRNLIPLLETALEFRYFEPFDGTAIESE